MLCKTVSMFLIVFDYHEFGVIVCFKSSAILVLTGSQEQH